MKIIHIISSFIGGGAERFVVSLCNELCKDKQLDIHIISLYNITPNMFLQNLVNERITIHTLAKKKGLDTSVFFKLYKTVKIINPQVVNTHLTAFNYNYLNILFSRKIKYCHTLHSDALLECPSRKNRTLRRLFYKNKVKAITISENSSASFQKHYKLTNDVLIYNGREGIVPTQQFKEVALEIDVYKITEQTKVVISIANLVPAKGHINLVNAFNLLLEENHNIVLLLIGDRRPGDEAIYKVIKDNLGNNLKYLGVKQNIEDYLLCADAFIMSSNIEGMPITLIEAMSAQCIPICTPVGGIPNMIVDKESGILSSDTSEYAIFEAIKRYLLLSENRKQEMKLKLLKQYEEKFNIKITANRYQKFYEC